MTSEYEIQNGERFGGRLHSKEDHPKNWNAMETDAEGVLDYCRRTTPTVTPSTATTLSTTTTFTTATTVTATTSGDRTADDPETCAVCELESPFGKGLHDDIFDALREVVDQKYHTEDNSTVNLAIARLQIWSLHDRWV